MRFKFKLPVLNKNSKFNKVKTTIFDFFSNLDLDYKRLLSFLSIVLVGYLLFTNVYNATKKGYELGLNHTHANVSTSTLANTTDIASQIQSIDIPFWLIIGFFVIVGWVIIRKLYYRSEYF